MFEEMIKGMSIEEVMKMYHDYKVLSDEAEQYLKACEVAIKDFVGEREEEIFVGDFKVSYKSAVRMGIDSKKLKEQLPDVFKAFSKETKYRTLRVS